MPLLRTSCPQRDARGPDNLDSLTGVNRSAVRLRAPHLAVDANGAYRRELGRSATSPADEDRAPGAHREAARVERGADDDEEEPGDRRRHHDDEPGAHAQRGPVHGRAVEQERARDERGGRDYREDAPAGVELPDEQTDCQQDEHDPHDIDREIADEHRLRARRGSEQNRKRECRSRQRSHARRRQLRKSCLHGPARPATTRGHRVARQWPARRNCPTRLSNASVLAGVRQRVDHWDGELGARDLHVHHVPPAVFARDIDVRSRSIRGRERLDVAPPSTRCDSFKVSPKAV